MSDVAAASRDSYLTQRRLNVDVRSFICPQITLGAAARHTQLDQYLCRAFELVVPASAARARTRPGSRTRTGPGAGAAVAAVFPLILQEKQKKISFT